MKTDPLETYVEAGVAAFAEAAVEMGVPHGRDILAQVESWFRFYRSWIGRRVVGFAGVSDIAVKLIADSFAVSEVALYQDSESPASVIDLGSGNGWPGLAARSLWAESSLALLDSRLGACEFLRGYIDSADLRNVSVVALRAEDAAKEPLFKAKFDLVMTRAMAQPGVALELSVPFCAAKGRVALWLGPEYAARVKRKPEVSELGVRLEEAREYNLAGEKGRRILAVYSLERDLPKGFPRSLSSIKARPLL